MTAAAAAPSQRDAAPAGGAAAAAAAAAERKKRGRLTELDAFRALMVLVVLFHALQASVGDLDTHAMRELSIGGVILGNIDVLLPIFFVLTGFAVYYQLAALVLGGKQLPASRVWLVKRALRLLPVYYLVFIIVWVVRYGGGQQQWTDLAWGLLLMQTWSTDHIFRTIDPGWYLSVEWHFSLLVAFALLPWMRAIRGWPRRSQLLALLVPPAALSALTIWWRSSLIDAKVPGDHWGAWFAPPSWGMMYGVGMLLGLALLLRPPHRWHLPAPAPLMLWVGSTAGMIYLQTQRGADKFASVWYFQLATIGVTLWLIAAIVANPECRTRRFMRWAPIQALAAASFVTYIVHAPMLRSFDARGVFPLDVPRMWWFSAIAIVIVSLFVGYLVHRYIEGPLASLEKLLVPKLDRVGEAVRSTRPTIAPGVALPAVELLTTEGVMRNLHDLPGGRPLLLLVHPDGPLPKDRRFHGATAAARTLDGVRAAAASRSFRLATMSPAPAPILLADRTDEEHSLQPLVRLVDPNAAVAKALGLATVTTADRRVLPEIALLVIDPEGTITHVLRDPDPHLLLHRALSAMDQQLGVTGVYQKRLEERPARPLPALSPQADEL
ncbi:MAG: acyltransferase family protein [Patulibacter sp.]